MKHTPGPWRVGSSIGSNHGHVAHLEATSVEGEVFANAQLITAAPDMLEALESVLQDFSALNVQQEITLRQVLSVINKAKGGT